MSYGVLPLAVKVVGHDVDVVKVLGQLGHVVPCGDGLEALQLVHQVCILATPDFLAFLGH